MSKTLPRDVLIVLCDPLDGRLARQVELAEALGRVRDATLANELVSTAAVATVELPTTATATLPLLVDPLRFARPPRMNRAQRRTAKRTEKRAKGARRR
jgi:hypothetical protein